MFDFFFYGTLMDPDVLGLVIGRPGPFAGLEEVHLYGYRTAYLDGQSYPALKEEAGARAEGRLARGLSLNEAARISYYESDLYRIESLEIETAAGQSATAWTFTSGPGMVMGGGWDFEAWRRIHKGRTVDGLRRGLKRGHSAPGRVDLTPYVEEWRGRAGR
ncbi:MAG: gamma-glutamylcyclotransferase family protein [Rhodospirillales bacterium]